MKTRLQFDGAWEGDALPGGMFVAAYPDGRLQTHLGTWQGPEWLRFPVMSAVTNFVCGTRQSSGVAVEVRPDGHTDRGQACGNRAVLYRANGELLINGDCNAPPYYGHGYRYEDAHGNVLSAAETFWRQDWNLYAWTERPDLIVGQGFESGCHVIYQNRRYLLEPGATEEIRFHRSGDQLAVAMIRRDIGAVVCHWMTVVDVLTLQDITDVPPPPPVCDSFVDRGDGNCANCGHSKSEHKPEEPPPVALPNHKFVVDRVNTEHPDLLRVNGPNEIREFYQRATNALHAHDPKWGMLTKSAGENHQVIGGERVSLDAAAYLTKDLVIDFIASAGDGHATNVTWGEKPRRESNLWLLPIPLDEEPPPPPDDLEERVERLERQQAALIAANAALEQRVKTLEEQEPPSNGMTPAQVVALIDAAFANAQITGRTQSAGGILGHSHGISGLSISRKP